MTLQARAGRGDDTHPAKRYLMEYRLLMQRRDALLGELEHLRAITLRAGDAPPQRASPARITPARGRTICSAWLTQKADCPK